MDLQGSSGVHRQALCRDTEISDHSARNFNLPEKGPAAQHGQPKSGSAVPVQTEHSDISRTPVQSQMCSDAQPIIEDDGDNGIAAPLRPHVLVASQASTGTVLMVTLPGPKSPLYNFKALAEEMHARGMHVLVSPASPTFKAGACLGSGPGDVIYKSLLQ